jgi:CRISPR-associated protein Csb2
MSQKIDWLERLPEARVWRARIIAEPPIGVESTVDVAHVIMAALNQTARNLFGDNRLPPDLHPDCRDDVRRDKTALEKHLHVFVQPEDLDRDGYLDHVALSLVENYGAEGFSRKALALLAACPGFWLGRSDARLEPGWLGPYCPHGFAGPSAAWQSMTPFALGHENKGPEEQIITCLNRLGLPAPDEIYRLTHAIKPDDREVVAATDFIPRGPAAGRWEDRWKQNEKHLAFWRLEFDAPVEGPIMIGALNHFGLGRFAPAD